METAFNRVTSALTAHGSVKHGSNWSCPGPLHQNGDRKPSLQVTSNNVGVGLYCHTGCDTKDIVSILGLCMSDLSDRVDSRPVADYVYTDADGTVLFKKTRFEPKDFKIFHPSGSGWQSKMGDAIPVLYKLPELKEAIARGETVFCVEGEKDVDTLAAKGYAATCNYEGAGKWRDEYSKHFRDANVIIIADRDEAGYAHAKKVKASLTGKAKSVRIMQAAVERPKADVTDHLTAGFTMDELVPLTGAFKPVGLGSLVAAGVREPRRIADGMLYAGGLHCIAGAPDSGKTTIALFWVVKLLSENGMVVFFDEEGGQEIIAEKLISLGAKPRDLDNLVYVPFPGKTWDDSDIAALMEFLGEHCPVMALWDSSAAFLARAGLDENSASAVTNWWARVLTPIARNFGSAVVVIDHDTKASEQSRYARGSGAKLAALDVQFKVEIKQPFSRGQDGLLRLNVTKDRRGYLHRDWLVQMTTSNGLIAPEFMHESEQGYTDSFKPSKRKVWGVLSEAPQTNEEIREKLGKLFPDEKPMARETVSIQLNELMREGRVVRAGNETRATWKRDPRYS